MKTLIIIPSRLSAKRLPGKPLIKINGLSIISHVVKKAEKANIGEVIVAAEDQEIVDDVEKNGGKAVLTSANNNTGTDRVYEAATKLNRPDVRLVMNLQGDEPLMDVDDIINLHKQMIKFDSKIGTLGAKIQDKSLFTKPNIVKVITKESLDNVEFSKALNFERNTNVVNHNIYHHLGIYCFQIEVLKEFISHKQSSNEIKYKLEQLRALDNKIDINVALAKSSPIGVDTEEDLVAIKKIMEYKS